EGEYSTSNDDSWDPIFILETRHYRTEHFLQEKPSNPCSGIDGRENEDSFKHDCKIIPVGKQFVHKGNLIEDMSHPYGKGYSSACTACKIDSNHFRIMG